MLARIADLSGPMGWLFAISVANAVIGIVAMYVLTALRTTPRRHWVEAFIAASVLVSLRTAYRNLYGLAPSYYGVAFNASIALTLVGMMIFVVIDYRAGRRAIGGVPSTRVSGFQ